MSRNPQGLQSIPPAAILIQLHGQEDIFWFNVIVNGAEWGRGVPVGSMAEFHEMEQELTEAVKHIHKNAFRNGYMAAQVDMRTALGIKD